MSLVQPNVIVGAPPSPALNTRSNPQPTTTPRNIVLCFDGTGNSFSKDVRPPIAA